MGALTLTNEGITVLRKAIREEEAARREALLAWVPLVGALTGLVGTATGLLLALFGR